MENGNNNSGAHVASSMFRQSRLSPGTNSFNPHNSHLRRKQYYSTLAMREVKHREVKQLAQDHTASHWGAGI